MTRGLRNNNPGNLRKSADHFRGEKASSDKEFKQFTAIEWGIRALILVLRTYFKRHRLHTIRQIVGRWAPASENDTRAYVRFVSQRTGYEPDAVLTADSDTLLALASAICEYENGAPVSEYAIYTGNFLAQNV